MSRHHKGRVLQQESCVPIKLQYLSNVIYSPTHGNLQDGCQLGCQLGFQYWSDMFSGLSDFDRNIVHCQGKVVLEQ